MKILIIDDDEMVRSVCSRMLQVMQHEVIAVASGAEAIEQISSDESRFDVILLDDAMPGMSGRETLIKLSDRGIRVPVVICSGRNVAPEEFAVSATGQPAAMLAKPFTMRNLQSALTQATQG